MKQRNAQHSRNSSSYSKPSRFSKPLLWLDTPAAPIQLWMSVALHLGYITLILLIFTPQFNTRDDTGMMLLAAGKIIALEPTEYLIFTNILLGHLLKTLYTWFPGGAWYALYLLLSLGLAHSVLLMVMARRVPRRSTYFLYTLYVLLFASQMFINLQFTITAVMVAIAGISLLFTPNAKGQSGNWQKWLLSAPTWGSVLLVLWAWMIRPESVLLTLVCMIPCFIFTLFSPKIRPFWNLFAIRCVLVIGVCTLVSSYHQYRYNHWGKENYLSFNKLCGEFLDFGLDMRVKVQPEDFGAIMNEVGWSAYDFEMMMNWFFMDEQLYSTPKLQHLQRAFEDYDKRTFSNTMIQQEIDNNRSSLTAKLRTRVAQTFMLPYALPAFVLLVIWLFITATPARTRFIFAIVFLLIFFAVAVYINYVTLMRDMPERVLFPMFAIAALLYPLLPALPASGSTLPFSPTRMAVVYLCMLSLPLWVIQASERLLSLSASARDNNRLYEQTISALAPKSDHLYLIWADGFPLSGVHPFSSLQETATMHALWLAWCQRTPTSAAMLSHYQIQNIYTDLMTRDHCSILFVANQIYHPSLVYHQRLNQFIKEHYGKTITTRPDGFRTIPSVPAGQQPDQYRTFIEMSLQYQK